MNHNNKKIIFVGFVIVLCGMLWFMVEKKQGSTHDEAFALVENEEAEETEPKTEKSDLVYVHIVGAVKKPGVYTFQEKPRVIDVIEKAGGFTKKAVTSDINQAEIVEDGVQIEIASVKSKKQQSLEVSQDMEKVNINEASKEQLMTLSGIGQSKADAIISYRETNGRYQTIEDIMNITGIKSGVFDKIKDKICV